MKKEVDQFIFLRPRQQFWAILLLFIGKLAFFFGNLAFFIGNLTFLFWQSCFFLHFGNPTCQQLKVLKLCQLLMVGSLRMIRFNAHQLSINHSRPIKKFQTISWQCLAKTESTQALSLPDFS